MANTLFAIIIVVLAVVRTASADAGDCLCSNCSPVVCSTATANCAKYGGSLSTCVDGLVSYECDFECSVSDSAALQSTCVSFCLNDQSCGTFNGVCESDESENVCFHENTVITYRGKKYTMQDLLDNKEPECQVPHTPSSRGYIISTSCGKTLRVTDTHLVATNKGFQAAYSLQVGDTLFGDDNNEQESKMSEICLVEKVIKEEKSQKYFGLNCVHSEVLADGIRVSTFGDFHTLPSWYMYYAGNSWGSQLASKMGSYVAEWYYDK